VLLFADYFGTSCLYVQYVIVHISTAISNILI